MTEPATLLGDLQFTALLVNHFGWDPVPAEVRRLSVGGSRHAVLPLARHGRTLALVHTASAAGALPDHRTRYAMRKRLGRAPLLIFVDALRAEQVWQWTECAPGAAGLYREASYVGHGLGEAVLARYFRPPATPAIRASGGAVNQVARIVLPALARRIRQRAPAAFRAAGGADLVARSRNPLRTLRELVEATDDVRLVRAFWNALTHCAVLDPACGTGARLVAAAAVLEPLYDACLERMQIWCDDLARSRPRHRPEKFGDFGRILTRVCHSTPLGDRRPWIRCEILGNNLYGIARNAAGVDRCRHRLAQLCDPGAAANTSETATGPSLNLRQGDWSRVVRDPRQARRDWAADPDVAARLDHLTEEADLLHRARCVIRNSAAVGAGGATLREREAALKRELAQLHRRGGNAGVEPFHLWAEFPGIAQRGGFDVVLGATGAMRPERTEPAGELRPVGNRAAKVVRESPASFAAVAVGPAPAEDPLVSFAAGAPGYPLALTSLLGDAAPGTLTTRGNAQLLRLPLLGFFCSARVPGSLVLWALDAARALRDAGVPVIGGFQTPLERECLDLLLRGRQPVVLCPARGIHDMRLPAAWARAVEEGRLLVISPFAATLRRPTMRIAEVRNQVAAALARALLVVHAPAGSRTFGLADQALHWGKPAFAPADPGNTDLLLLGVRPSRELAQLYPNLALPETRWGAS